MLKKKERMGTSTHRAHSVLVVDNDVAMRDFLTFVLDDAGYGCTGVPDAAAARDELLARDYGVVLIDVRLPRERAHDLVQWVSSALLGVESVVMSTLDDPGIAEAASSSGACGWLVKPFSVDELLGMVRNANGRAQRVQGGVAARRNTAEPDEPRIPPGFYAGLVGRSEGAGHERRTRAGIPCRWTSRG